MKIVIIFAALLVSFTCNSQTGMNTKKHPAKHSNAKAAPDKKIQTQQANNSGYLYSNTNNNAFATRPVLANHYEISDPTLKALNARSEGYNVKIGKSGVVGMSKHNYGFADGHIIFHTNNSTTSGTSTGSGAVGTGSSPGSMGSSGPGTGLNGKSPYAGSGMFGIGMPGPSDHLIAPQKRPVIKKYK